MNQGQQAPKQHYVGTLVGESTSTEFRLAVAQEAIREQDIIAVDASFKPTDGSDKIEHIRIWAKVKRIERINPLFPTEAGHELAATQTEPLDTILSFSREMVTAVCQILGYEPIAGDKEGKLKQLRYPAQPATNAYRPGLNDIERVVEGGLRANQHRALDIAHLANRTDIGIKVDGNAIVTRHLAILAMTGAGKSWTARRIIEQLASKNYPIIIFDPHGDYSKLRDYPELKEKVVNYYAQFPLFDEDAETVAKMVETLGYELTPAMQTMFSSLFEASKKFWVDDKDERKEREEWLNQYVSEEKRRYALEQDLWLVAKLAEAGEHILGLANSTNERKKLEEWGWKDFSRYTGTDKKTLEGLKKRTSRAAHVFKGMETNNRLAASNGAVSLPTEKSKLVEYGKISVVSLSGYSRDVQASIYALITEDIFQKKTTDSLRWPVVLLLEEAHYFAPGSANSSAERQATAITRRIAQEGRKFKVGLILVSQRPSRLDETTLSQCNSFVIMRMVNPADQSFVRNIIESLGEDDARLLPDLDVGEALITGQMVNFPVLVKMREPDSKSKYIEEDAFHELEKLKSAMKKR